MLDIKFGTDGWRAVIADQFTFPNVERVAYAVGMYVRKTYHQNSSNDLPVLIGYDTRFLADKFAYRAGEVLVSLGIPVRLADHDVPTPCIAFAASHTPSAGALQFTASHNPPEYCGIKYIPHFGGPATNEITNDILLHLKDIPDGYTAPKTALPLFDPKPPYMESLRNFINFKKIGASQLKIGFDALYSTTRGYLDALLNQAGLDVHTLHNWRDTLFGGGMPEPKPEYLQQLVQLVKERRLDIGLATDGDGDRMAVLDEFGNYLSPNHLFCLLVRHLVKNHGLTGSIVRTVATTHHLDRLAELYGLEVVETPVGFKYIGEVMRGSDVLIGGEESGGISVKGHIPEKDGILANLLMVEMLAYENKPLSQIWQSLTAETGLSLVYRRADVNISSAVQKVLMERLDEKPLTTLGGEQITKIGRKDGLKLYVDHHNWLLIRPSGTEPLLRLYAEGTPAGRVDRLMSDFVAQVQDLINTINPTGLVNESTVGAARH